MEIDEKTKHRISTDLRKLTDKYKPEEHIAMALYLCGSILKALKISKNEKINLVMSKGLNEIIAEYGTPCIKLKEIFKILRIFFYSKDIDIDAKTDVINNLVSFYENGKEKN